MKVKKVKKMKHLRETMQDRLLVFTVHGSGPIQWAMKDKLETNGKFLKSITKTVEFICTN